MNPRRLSLILCLAALGACATDDGSEFDSSADQQTLLAPDQAVPSEEEAAAKASKTIDESNADAELEKLKQELGDGD